MWSLCNTFYQSGVSYKIKKMQQHLFVNLFSSTMGVSNVYILGVIRLGVRPTKKPNDWPWESRKTVLYMLVWPDIAAVAVVGFFIPLRRCKVVSFNSVDFA